MSSTGNNLSLNDKINEINDWVQKQFNPEIWGYINLTRDQLKDLSFQDCGEICYILCEQSIHTQARLNKVKAAIKWGNDRLDMMIYNEIDQYGTKYSKYEERRMLTIRGNDVLQKMWKEISHLEQKREALDQLAHRIDNLARAMRDVRGGKFEYREAKTGN